MAGRPRIRHSITVRRRPATLTSLRSLLTSACLMATLPGALGAAANNARFQSQLPDLELLEFLGSFATDEGDWIDPESLLDNNIAELLDATEGTAADSSGSRVNDGATNDSAQDSDHD